MSTQTIPATADRGRRRLIEALLRGPGPTRRTTRISETAVSDALGGSCMVWIERALIESLQTSDSIDRAAALAGQITAARVGGEFWAPAPSWSPKVTFVVKPARRSHLAPAVAYALERVGSAGVGVLLPAAPWAASAAAGLKRRGVSVHIGAASPWPVLDMAEEVLVGGNDDLGLLALFAGRMVHGWSRGYLTGWGPTRDRLDIPRRGERGVAQLAAAALVDGVRYHDPYGGGVTTAEAIVERLTEWRRVADEDRDLACLAGMAGWKRARIKQFLGPGAATAPFLDQADACVSRAQAADGSVAVWPSRAPAHLTDLAERAGVPLRRVEDGFVRSVGLGSDLLPPCSIVIDRRGIYYDPARPSDLEQILTETDFSPALLDRARALTARLLAGRVTKYNTGGGPFERPAAARVVLVPGQVEDDLSLRLGGAGCAGNLDLVRRVRACEPDAFIVYRPHPDVEAGNRIGAEPDEAMLRHVDRIDRESAMTALLDGADAVHVLTSLAGFEALLRGRDVIVHGQPFYCGWGLTRDLSPPPRRGRTLSLAELVAGTLILYPRYLDPVTGQLCPPEILVERLARMRRGETWAVKALRALRRRFEPVRPAMRTPELARV